MSYFYQKIELLQYHNLLLKIAFTSGLNQDTACSYTFGFEPVSGYSFSKGHQKYQNINSKIWLSTYDDTFPPKVTKPDKLKR